MTQSPNPLNDPNYDPLASFDKRPAVSFDPSRVSEITGEPGHSMGQWVQLEVDGYAQMVQRRDPKTKALMAYEDTGKPMMSMVIAVKEKGVDKSLWSKVPGGLLTALRNAQKELAETTGEADRRIRPGDLLAVRWAANGQKTSNDPMMNAPKIFEAKVRPGVLPAPKGEADPFESAASQPAAPAAQPVQPAPQAAASDPWASTPAPAVGGDPWATPAAAQQPAQPAAAAPAQPTAAPALAAAAPVTDDPFAIPASSSDEPPF